MKPPPPGGGDGSGWVGHFQTLSPPPSPWGSLSHSLPTEGRTVQWPEANRRRQRHTNPDQGLVPEWLCRSVLRVWRTWACVVRTRPRAVGGRRFAGAALPLLRSWGARSAPCGPDARVRVTATRGAGGGQRASPDERLCARTRPSLVHRASCGFRRGGGGGGGAGVRLSRCRRNPASVGLYLTLLHRLRRAIPHPPAPPP